jgi:uncharacterized protein
MPVVPLDLHHTAFDPSRVRGQVRGSSLFLMDRMSGRWTAVPDSWLAVFPLLGSEAAARQYPAVRRLREYLQEREIGIRTSDRTFGGLNTLIVKLTSACNHACAYCYDFDTRLKARRIDRGVAISAIEQALASCTDSLQVILHGGEPMLVWDLVEDLVVTGEQLATDQGKRIRFVGQSNMSRLTAAVGRFSVEHDIVWGISVDGPPDVHDHFRTYRTGRGTYADFEDALRAFPRFIRSCGVLSTVTTANQSRLLEVARHFRALEMASWDWTLFQAIGRGREESERFEPDTQTVIQSWTELFDAVLAGEFDGFPIKPVLKYVENFVSGPGPNMCMRPQCGAARDLASISVDGSIEACDCIDRRGPLAGLGSLSKDSLEDARRSPLAELIRSRDLSSTRCGTCIWWAICGGGCLAHAPSLNEIPELACGLSLTAFDRIADQLVQPDGPLRRYLESVRVDAP